MFPRDDGQPWTAWDWQNWRRRTFARALAAAAGVEHARPYDLRHSFASLLLAEGRSVHYVARQLGDAPSMTLDGYGHVIDELEDTASTLRPPSAPRADAPVPTRYPQPLPAGARDEAGAAESPAGAGLSVSAPGTIRTCDLLIRRQRRR